MSGLQKGLMSDVASLEAKIGEPFILILGDEYYYKTNHEKFLTTYKQNKKVSIDWNLKLWMSRIRKIILSS